MKKTLYSLMLDDNVMRLADLQAHRLGLPSSAYVNQVLANAVGYVTPAERINSIFAAAEALLAPDQELVPFFTPNTGLMSMKSSLSYKYRPTVKYEVALSAEAGDTLGTLNVIFRTQSAELISLLTAFFRLWKGIEDRCFPGRFGYALYDGRLERSLRLPETDVTAEEIAEAITDYVSLFDHCMKAYLAGQMDEADVDGAYRAAIQAAKVKI